MLVSKENGYTWPELRRALKATWDVMAAPADTTEDKDA